MLTQDNVKFVLNHPDLATFNPVKFYLIRDGEIHHGKVQVDGGGLPDTKTTEETLEKMPSLPSTSSVPAAPPDDPVWRRLGLRLQSAPVDNVKRINQELHGGLTVIQLRTDSPADKAGIRPGDVLVGLHQWEMLTQDNVMFVLNHPDLATINPMMFYIIRDGQVHRGTVTSGVTPPARRLSTLPTSARPWPSGRRQPARQKVQPLNLFQRTACMTRPVVDDLDRPPFGRVELVVRVDAEAGGTAWRPGLPAHRGRPAGFSARASVLPTIGGRPGFRPRRPAATVNAGPQWSRPALLLIRGVRPNSPVTTTSVLSSRPRSARSRNRPDRAASSLGKAGP